MNTKLKGHLSCLAAYLIFGFNLIVGKRLTSEHLFSPICIFTFRSLGACCLFWILSFVVPSAHEKVERKDYIKIFFASMIGFFCCQFFFLAGIERVTALDASIISTMSPVYTMLVAALVLKEPITAKKGIGVALSLAGIILLILNSVTIRSGADHTEPLGVGFMVLNSLSFACYLGIFRPLISKYSVITFMKWIFLFSLIVTLPFSIKEILTIDYSAVPGSCWWELGFMVFFATFVAYFLVPVGQKHLRPTVVSLYSYVQPMIAALTAIYLGMDTLTWQKVVAAVITVTGVVLVNKSRAKASES